MRLALQVIVIISLFCQADILGNVKICLKLAAKKKKRFTTTKIKEILRLNNTPHHHTNQRAISTYLLFSERYIPSKDSTQGYGASKNQTQVNISHIPRWLSESYHDWSVEIGGFWNFDVSLVVFKANRLSRILKDQQVKQLKGKSVG